MSVCLLFSTKILGKGKVFEVDYLIKKKSQHFYRNFERCH